VRIVQEPNYQEREEQLRQRELELRLRELESEIHRVDPPFHPTVKETGDRKSARTFRRDLILAAKVSGFFLIGVVVVYVSQWLAWISFFALIGAVGWAWFEFGRK
jgi:Flp pilus assembly protein TadB